jgi:hypothetical protein
LTGSCRGTQPCIAVVHTCAARWLWGCHCTPCVRSPALLSCTPALHARHCTPYPTAATSTQPPPPHTHHTTTPTHAPPPRCRRPHIRRRRHRRRRRRRRRRLLAHQQWHDCLHHAARGQPGAQRGGWDPTDCSEERIGGLPAVVQRAVPGQVGRGMQPFTPSVPQSCHPSTSHPLCRSTPTSTCPPSLPTTWQGKHPPAPSLPVSCPPPPFAAPQRL